MKDLFAGLEAGLLMGAALIALAGVALGAAAVGLAWWLS